MSEQRLTTVATAERVCFDYTDVLSILCKKRWSFWDAVYGVMPIFGMVLKSSPVAARPPAERLQTLALQVLSTQVSDETNIVRLITLAQQQGLTELDIQLPYPLTAAQLQAIEQGCHSKLRLSQVDEQLLIRTSSR